MLKIIAYNRAKLKRFLSVRFSSLGRTETRKSLKVAECFIKGSSEHAAGETEREIHAGQAWTKRA